MCSSSAVKQSSEAFTFLKEIQSNIKRLYPEINNEFEYVQSLEDQVGSQIQ